MKDELQQQLNRFDKLDTECDIARQVQIDEINRRFDAIKVDRDIQRCVIHMALQSPIELNSMEDVITFSSKVEVLTKD